jgi:D-glucosaminate-6-phosphate ammonia-lyase
MASTSVFARFGVRTVINAAGPQTRLSGGMMAEAVSAAMVEASRACVDVAELQAAASEVIASVTGAEAGCVTGGGAAALMLGAAACMTGLDVGRMNCLPYSGSFANEFIMSRSQRNQYDRAVRQAGGVLIEVGIPDRFTGAGVRDAEPADFVQALTPRTAALLWFAQQNSEPALSDLVRIARDAGLPVLVDAASQLPPKSNLTLFFEIGADLVAISGGKALGGPQASGILAGRRELVQAAVLQMMDFDLPRPLFRPLGRLFEGLDLASLPQHGIGRPAKAGKEEIIGLLTALQLYVEHDPQTKALVWKDLCERILASAALTFRHDRMRVVEDPRRPGAFFVEIVLSGVGQALGIAGRLQDGDPSISVNLSRYRDGVLLLSPMCLDPNDIMTLGVAVGRALSDNT